MKAENPLLDLILTRPFVTVSECFGKVAERPGQLGYGRNVRLWMTVLMHLGAW